jgi:hypothetical protein
MAVCLREKGLPLEIIRRTGPDWPDDPISTGTAIISFDLLRKPGSVLAMTTLANRRGTRSLDPAAERNMQLKTDDSSAVGIWNGNAWSAASLALAADSWAKMSLELDYTQGTFALRLNGQHVASGQFDSAKQPFDGLAFACAKGEAYTDNVHVRWAW